MSSLTATPSDALSLVRLDASFADVLADAVGVARTRTDTGASVDVRPMSVITTAARVYRQLNANGDFEANITGWTALGSAALAWSATRATRGTHSLQVTSSATANGPGVESEHCPVTPGVEYATSGQQWTTLTQGLAVGINWYNAAGALIGTTLPTAVWVTPPSAWQLQQRSGSIAPPGSVTATCVAQWVKTSHPAAATSFWLDELRLLQLVSTDGIAMQVAVGGVTTVYDTEMPLDVAVSYVASGYLINGTWAVLRSTANAGPVTVGTAGFAWLKDPTAPGNNMRIAITQRALLACLATGSPRALGYGGISTETRPARSAQLDVNNRENPIVTSKRRGSVSAGLLLAPHTFADRDALRDLLTPGTPLLFQAPGQYGVPDRYMSFGDESVDMLGQRQTFQPRVFTLPFVVTDAAAGPAQGPAGARYMDLCDQVPDWDSVVASEGGAADGFERTVVSGLGSAYVGGAYTTVGDASVAAGVATLSLATVGTRVQGILAGVSLAATSLSATVQVPVLALGSYIEFAVFARYVDDLNNFAISLRFNPSGAVLADIRVRVAGVNTDLGNAALPGITVVPGSTLRLWAEVGDGSLPTLRLRGWLAGTREPSTWNVDTVDTSGALPNPGAVGFGGILNVGNTNARPVSVAVSAFRASGPLTWTDVVDGAIG
jgi:hypothetical protein